MFDYAATWGDNSSPTVVLVPGAGGTRWLWTPHAERLAAEYRVVTLDMPAHGTHPDASFSFDRAVEDLGHILDEEGSAVLVGHSLGGHVAMEAASAHENQVDGLVVAGVSPSGLAKKCLHLPLSYVLEVAVHSTRIREWLDEQHGLDNDQQVPPASAETHDEVVATARGMRGGLFRDSFSALEGYDGKSMLTYGEGEIEAVTAGKIAEQADAQLQWYEGGHSVPSRKPGVFAKIVSQFLAEIYGEKQAVEKTT